MSDKFPSLRGVDRIYTVHQVSSCTFVYKDSPHMVQINDMDTMREFGEFLLARGFTHNERALKEMGVFIYERVSK